MVKRKTTNANASEVVPLRCQATQGGGGEGRVFGGSVVAGLDEGQPPVKKQPSNPLVVRDSPGYVIQ